MRFKPRTQSGVSQESIRSQSGVSQEAVRSQSGVSQESVRSESGHQDKLKILPKDRMGQDSLSRSKAQHGRDSVSHPVPRDITGQSRKGQSKTGKGPSKIKL